MTQAMTGEGKLYLLTVKPNSQRERKMPRPIGKGWVQDHLASCHGDLVSSPLARAICPTRCRPFCKWNKENSSSKARTAQPLAPRDSSSSTRTQVLWAPGHPGGGEGAGSHSGSKGGRSWDAYCYHCLPALPDDAPVPAPAGDQKDGDPLEKKVPDQPPQLPQSDTQHL